MNVLPPLGLGDGARQLRDEHLLGRARLEHAHRAAADEDFLHAPAVSDQLSAVKTQLRALEVRQK